MVAADLPELTLCEGTEKPDDSFVLLREKKTKIMISKTIKANIKSVIRFLNLNPSLMSSKILVKLRKIITIAGSIA